MNKMKTSKTSKVKTKTSKAKLKPHYVDNKKFLQAMTEYRSLREIAEQKKRKAPQITNYIGECFLKIANHLSYRPNFINYTYRDDMISDGIENCLQYMSNFDPHKSNNPFAYFTQIIYYAFIRRIQKEKKQQDVKAKLIANSDTEMMLDSLTGDDAQYKNQMLEFLKKNVFPSVASDTKPKENKKKKKLH
tara:strand:+ start:165 stop:734 length:570 start_codon:yes stop_codon:yes gene_type:complete